LPGAAVGGEQAEGTFLRALATLQFIKFGFEFLEHRDMRIAVELNKIGQQNQGAFDALNELGLIFGVLWHDDAVERTVRARNIT
jgi:hypothetical protein